MQPKNHGQKSPIVFIMVWVLLVIFQNSSLATDLQPKSRKSRPSRILLDPKYFAIEDPAIAAAKMRADSREYGIDENVVLKSYSKNKSFNSGNVTVSLAAGTYNFDINDQTNKLVFESAEVEKTVIFVADRFLSINEVATMMESGIRIFKKLYSFSPRMAFLVKVSSESYAELEKQPFFLFATEYGYQYKSSSDCRGGPRVRYNINCLGEYKKSLFGEDLEKLGFDLVFFGEKGNSISAFGRCDQFQAVASLWWVENVYWNPKIRSNDEVFEESYLFDQKSNEDDLRLSWASRNLIAGKLSWDGVGVNVGIMEDTLVFEGGPLNGVLLDGSDKVTQGPDLNSNHPSGMSYLIAGRRDMENDCTNDVLQGMATRSMILFQSYSTGRGLDEFFHTFENANIQLSSHSYDFILGPDEPEQYSENVHFLDEQAATGSIMFASVGNMSDGPEVDSPAVGKNVIAIGGVNPYPVSGLEVGEIYSGSVVGPSKYGTLKPELVAPAGTGASRFGIPQYRPVFDGAESYCSLYNYRKKSGTSSATALATGAIATALPGIIAELDEGENLRSDLVKALVINSAIPLKGNDPDGAKGHANCTFGYGLINPISCVYREGGDYVDSYLRRQIFQGNVLVDVPYPTIQFEVGAMEDPDDPNTTHEPEKVSVTLAYNDEAGIALNPDGTLVEEGMLYNNLDMVVSSPNQNPDGMVLANFVTNESPIEKMVFYGSAERVLTGYWSIYVNFDGTGLSSSSQDFTVVFDVHYKKPQLTIGVTTPITVHAGREFTVQGSVRNTGGGVAAGV